MYYSSYEGGLRLPELGTLDRAVYNVLIAVLTVLTVGGVLGFLLLFLVIVYPLTEPNVAGVSHTAGVFGLILFSVLMAIVIGALVTGLARKYPIFGEAGVTYGAPEWTPVYPLVMPTRQAPERVRRLVREGRLIAGLVAVGILLAGFVFATSVLSGNLLYRDGSVRVLWGPGWEMVHYQPEDVTAVSVVQFRPTGRGSARSEWRIDFELEMQDGRYYRFHVTDGEFQKDGELSRVKLLAEILDCYTEAKVTFYDSGHLPDVVHDQQYSVEDQQILEELFGIS